MEDWNMIAADCVVISRCCQCLVLQIVVFILLEFPYKLNRKTKQYVKKQLGNPKREGNAMERESNGYYIDVGHSRSFRIEVFCSGGIVVIVWRKLRRCRRICLGRVSFHLEAFGAERTWKKASQCIL